MGGGLHPELPYRQVVAQIYLVGEFARRVGEYPRAWLWLAAAQQLADPNDPDIGLEYMAATQLDELKGYLTVSNLPATHHIVAELAAEEIQLVQRLLEMLRAQRPSASGSTPPPAVTR